MQWSWISQNWTIIWQYTLDNALLGLVPPLLGLVIAVPLGIACVARRWLYPPLLSLTSALYALPSLALFVVLIDYTGLGNLTVIIPLTLFSLCVLLPKVVDGLRSVPEPVRQAATAMGFTQVRRLVEVELPLSVPVVDRRAAHRRRIQHQPGQSGPADRGQQPRLLLHRRPAARLPDRDLRRPGADTPAGAGVRPDPGGCPAAAHSLGSWPPDPPEPAHAAGCAPMMGTLR